jgi:glucosylceramidase
MARHPWPLATLLLLAPVAEAAPPLPSALGPDLAPFVQTSAAGDRFRSLPPVRFTRSRARGGLTVTVTPAARRQVLEGLGGALTEASASVLAQLSGPTRSGILDRCFGPLGARFTMTRTPIGACDFSVRGQWSYDDVAGDTALEHFSLAPDRAGPAGEYALLPLVKDALARTPGLKVVASAWTAPAWMKDNQAWYGQGRGGSLLPEHYATFASYLVRYLEAYRAEGVPVWGLTPLNEPGGNGGQWESMEFPAPALQTFIRDHLGPRLASQGLAGVKLIQFDHNRDASALEHARAVLGDPATARYVWGTGLHWYSTTNSASTEVLDELIRRYPGKAILHTEGCIDGIGTAEGSPNGQFLGWRQEAWWWTPGATDWGYYWAPAQERAAHPKYTPVHRYARDLVQGLNHGFSAWLDWNLVLDHRGGPNHVNNLCAAPVMVDPATEEVHCTPLYYVMAHFSRYLQPGAQVVRTVTHAPGLPADAFHATAAVSADQRHLVVIAFNPSARPLRYRLLLGGRQATVAIPANAIQTLRIPLLQPRSGAQE